MVKCELCGMELKTTQALAGHKQFKHELAGRYAEAYQLAKSVELLEKKKSELQNEKIKAEANLTQIRQQIDEIEKKKAEKHAELMELEQLGKIKVSEFIKICRLQLIQAGWYPLQEMDTSSLALLAFLRWSLNRKI